MYFRPCLRECFDSPRSIQLPKLYTTDRDQCKMSSAITRACMYPNTPNAHYKKLRKSITRAAPTPMNSASSSAATVAKPGDSDGITVDVIPEIVSVVEPSVSFSESVEHGSSTSKTHVAASDAAGEVSTNSDDIVHSASAPGCICRFAGGQRWTLDSLRLNASERKANFYPQLSDIEMSGTLVIWKIWRGY